MSIVDIGRFHSAQDLTPRFRLGVGQRLPSLLKGMVLVSLIVAPILAGAQADELTLEQAIAQARGNRASVQAARLRLEQARSTRRSLGSFPTTTLLLGYSNDMRVGGSDEDLVISQPIDIFGRRSAARSSGDALVLQAEASLRLVEQKLQGDVVAIYIESVAASSRLANAREAEEAAARLLDAIKRLVEGGRLPGVQATRVSIELERARAARKQRESEVAAGIRRLHGVLGADTPRTPAGFPSIATPSIDERDLILQRADLLLLNADVASADADIRIALTNRLPQLELQGRRTPWHESERAYGARVQLSFPLFDSGRSRAEETAAKKSAEAARKSLADLVRIARTEIDAARIEVQGAQEQIASLGMVLQTTRDLVSKSQAGLVAGANTLVDVLDAVRALREIQESLTEARVTLALAQARYLEATGGLLEVRP